MLQIKQPVPPAWVKALISVALGLHKIYTKYLSLPRLKEFAYIPVLHDDFAKTGMCPAGVSACPFPSKSGGCEAMYRLHPGHGHVEPWYMPAPSIYTKLKTRVLASMGLYNTNAIPGPKFMPQGFRTEELGPVSYQQSGREAVLANAEAIHGGPLNGPWAFSAELSAHE
ncbi:hypothetical protein FRC09_008402 [Ceratobasidium sp. 395]|nr:hypothetical protein FRC09_008402 [Ceratobasidium sp. 395]